MSTTRRWADLCACCDPSRTSARRPRPPGPAPVNGEGPERVEPFTWRGRAGGLCADPDLAVRFIGYHRNSRLKPDSSRGVDCPAHRDPLPRRNALPVKTEAIGKTYPRGVYAVGREKVKEYAAAVGETNSVHLDPEAARSAGYDDVVAPPMFAVVYSAPVMAPAIFDPEVGINFAAMVHGGQEFVWGPPVVAGDEITTEAAVKDISESDGRGFYVFETVSTNQEGETVCTGTWTNIVRGV